mmetsp:Transcript_201/g.249  ORF Transcript_201/g.249 Transcript_201/m.249 type:complete len:185 (+) Transcript_201:103-657(+)
MKLSTRVLLGAGLLVGAASAFSMSMSSSSSVQTSDRRAFLSKSAAAVVASGLSVSQPNAAFADEDLYADFITTESGMKYKVIKEGTGAIPEAGQNVKAHYTGWLEGFDSIRKFDSSRDRGRPFSFRVGAGQVIRGWDESFAAMKVGERRQIILPSRLAYGERGAGGIIPGGATLYFDVELLSIQ